MTTPILETPRLILRQKRLEDAPRIQQMFPHWEIVQYLNAQIPWPYPADGVATYIQSTLDKPEGEEYNWSITLKKDPDSQLIGAIDLYPHNPEDSRGFWIGLDYQNQGYMTEAVVAVNDFAFDQLGMPELILNNAEPNKGSHRLKELSGAKIISADREADYVSGRFRQIRWRLTAADWHANRHRMIRKDEAKLDRPALSPAHTSPEF